MFVLQILYIYIIPLDFFPKNELRHLCPLNPIQTPEISFSMGSRMSCAIYVP